jgi:hypothetical protein
VFEKFLLTSLLPAGKGHSQILNKGTNTLAYLAKQSVMKEKGFITFRNQCYKTFFFLTNGTAK